MQIRFHKLVGWSTIFNSLALDVHVVLCPENVEGPEEYPYGVSAADGVAAFAEVVGEAAVVQTLDLVHALMDGRIR